MGFNETAMFAQMKKGQGETNDRLDRLVAAQQKTNLLLEGLIEALKSKP
jgi:hypothetical protein